MREETTLGSVKYKKERMILNLYFDLVFHHAVAHRHSGNA